MATVRIAGLSVSAGIGGRSLRFGSGSIWSDRCGGGLRLVRSIGIGLKLGIILPNFSTDCYCPLWDCEFRDGDTITTSGWTFFFFERTTVDWRLSCDDGVPGGAPCNDSDRYFGLSLGLGRFTMEWDVSDVQGS